MANTEKPEVSPEEIKKAQTLWASFTISMKYSIIATIAVLILLALITL